MKVKICGVTNKDDAVWAINYGADLIGLNFWKESPRHVSATSAKNWVPALPPFASVVGVFVNAAPEEIVKTVDALGLKGVQLHGDEGPDVVAFLKQLLLTLNRPVFIIKALRIAGEDDLKRAELFRDSVDYFLLDSRVEGAMGGTGVSFNWDWVKKAGELGKPFFVAGGLTPENVKEAVKKTSPYGVDTASGVEKSPKRKDPEKIKQFISHAKS